MTREKLLEALGNCTDDQLAYAVHAAASLRLLFNARLHYAIAAVYDKERTDREGSMRKIQDQTLSNVDDSARRQTTEVLAP